MRGHSAARSAGIAAGAACAGVPQRPSHCRTVVQVGCEGLFLSSTLLVRDALHGLVSAVCCAWSVCLLG